MFGRTGPSANTSSFTPQPLRKKTKDARDREGYVFHVDEFALGNLDGNKKKFYTSVHYPTDHTESYLTYDETKDLFRFKIRPLSLDEPLLMPKSRTPPFPWADAPIAAKMLEGEFGLVDVIGHGISFDTSEGKVEVIRGVKEEEEMEVVGEEREKDGPKKPSWDGYNPNLTPMGENRRNKGYNKNTKKSNNDDNGQPVAKIQELEVLSLHKCHLTVTLRRPSRWTVPLINREGEIYSVDLPSNRSGKLNWRQATSRDFVNGRATESGAGPLDIEAEQETFRIGTCLSYRFTMCLETNQVKMIGQFLDKFRLVYNADPSMNPSPTLWGYKSSGTELIDIRKENEKRIHMEPYPPPLPPSYGKTFRALPFTIRWLIEGLCSHNIILPHERPRLIQAMEDIMPINASNRAHREKTTKWRERTLTSLFNEERISDKIEYMLRRRSRTHRRPGPPEPEHVKWIYRVHVTPTKILLFPPDPEAGNSVLRKFGVAGLTNRFLRVAFTDEDNRIRIDPSAKQAYLNDDGQGVLGRVQRCLDEGIEAAGRRYEFLASSAAQLKDSACWFLCNGPDLNVGMIRDWAGQVEERVVAKFAARLGQPFSTTTYVKIEGEQLSARPDIKRNGYTFTDGVGVCSQDVATAAARALGSAKSRDAQPSAIQIRLGGCKGVLCVDSNLTGFQYALRDSMEKFKSNLVDLNVVRASNHSIGHLNRQYITILDELGIPEPVFLRRFKQERDRIIGLPKRFATRQQNRSDGKLVQRMAVFPSVNLAEAGFNSDACLIEVLRVVEVRLLWDLKWKARLPLEQSAFLIGVADETGLLNEGEVFCQVHDPDDDSKGPEVIVGDVVVCRPPVLHPGDIRKVVAVDCPQLRHLKNVIVFNTKGERDITNTLAGGDLDGDDYTLIWDPDFLFETNREPMDYKAPKPKLVSRVIEADLKDNMVSYMMNDTLGAIGSAHLAWSDLKGVSSPECIELAHLHSRAVDFSKTGQPANFPNILRPRRWPMYMDKPPSLSYESDKILGKLFCLAGGDRAFRPVTENEIFVGMDPRIASIPVPLDILKLAATLKRRYDHDLFSILLRYRLTEAEAMAGLVLHNHRRKRVKDGDLKDPIRDAFGIIVTSAIEQGQQQLQELRLPHEMDGGLSPLQLLAVAAYQISYDKQHAHLFREEEGADQATDQGGLEGKVQDDVNVPTRLISFAWLLWPDIVSLPAVAPEGTAKMRAVPQHASRFGRRENETEGSLVVLE